MMHPSGGQEERVSSVGGPEQGQEGEKYRITICEIDYVTTSRRYHFPSSSTSPSSPFGTSGGLHAKVVTENGIQLSKFFPIFPLPVTVFFFSLHCFLLIVPSKSVSWWMRRRILVQSGSVHEIRQRRLRGFSIIKRRSVTILLVAYFTLLLFAGGASASCGISL